MVNGLIQTSYIKYFQFEISCPLRESSCNHASAIAPQFLYFVAPHFPSDFPIFIVDHWPKTCAPKTWVRVSILDKNDLPIYYIIFGELYVGIEAGCFRKKGTTTFLEKRNTFTIFF